MDLTDPRDRERAAREGAVVAEAAARLGAEVVDCAPAALGRTGVYRVQMRPRAGSEAPTGSVLPLADGGVGAAKVTSLRDSITAPERVHRLVHVLHGLGAPVPGVLHPDLLDVDGLQVAFWPWLAPARVTARQWGALTGAFHRAAAPLLTGPDTGPDAYRPDTVLRARLETVQALAVAPGHTLPRARELLNRLARALDEAVHDALVVQAGAPTVVALGDNQPVNVMHAPGRDGAPGHLVLNDFERLEAGPPGLDLAAVLMGVWHYGFDPGVFEQFRRGYGPDAPTREQVVPFVRLRELSGLLVALLHADRDPAMARQARVRAGCLDGPGAGAPWTFVGPQSAMSLVPDAPLPHQRHVNGRH